MTCWDKANLTLRNLFMGGASNYFMGYQSTLGRVMFAELLDDHLQKNNQRRLSIVGPCYTHDQWLAVQAERRRVEAQAQLMADAGAQDARALTIVALDVTND
jgi:hypothetical protein